MSWCSICVKARAREDKHYTAVCAERESGVAKVALDYAQVEDTVPTDGEAEGKDATTAEQEARATAAKAGKETHKRRLLVGRDRWTKAACSFLVQCKGTGDPSIVDKVFELDRRAGVQESSPENGRRASTGGRARGRRKGTHARDHVQESSRL